MRIHLHQKNSVAVSEYISRHTRSSAKWSGKRPLNLGKSIAKKSRQITISKILSRSSTGRRKSETSLAFLFTMGISLRGVFLSDNSPPSSGGLRILQYTSLQKSLSILINKADKDSSSIDACGFQFDVVDALAEAARTSIYATEFFLGICRCEC